MSSYNKGQSYLGYDKISLKCQSSPALSLPQVRDAISRLGKAEGGR